MSVQAFAAIILSLMSVYSYKHDELTKRNIFIEDDILDDSNWDLKENKEFISLSDKIQDDKSMVDKEFGNGSFENIKICSTTAYEDFVHDTTMLGLFDNTCDKLDSIWLKVSLEWKDVIDNILKNRNITIFGNNERLQMLFGNTFIEILDTMNDWFSDKLDDNSYLAIKHDISIHFIAWIIKKKTKLFFSGYDVCDDIEYELDNYEIRWDVRECVISRVMDTFYSYSLDDSSVGVKKPNCSDLNSKFLGLTVNFEISILFFYQYGVGYGATLDGTISNFKSKRIGGSIILGIEGFIEIMFLKNGNNLYNQTNLMVALDIQVALSIGGSMLFPVDSLSNKLLKGLSGYSVRFGLGISPFIASLSFAKAWQDKIRQGGVNATAICEKVQHNRTKSPTVTRKPTRSPRPTRPPHKAIFPTASM